jgi:hypothetical protein
MRIPGERIKRTRLIQTEKYVVAVEVEMVIPVDDPSEPCLRRRGPCMGPRQINMGNPLHTNPTRWREAPATASANAPLIPRWRVLTLRVSAVPQRGKTNQPRAAPWVPMQRGKGLFLKEFGALKGRHSSGRFRYTGPFIF